MKRHFGYVGQAGTGKTTTLIKDLEEYLNTKEWGSHKSLLALTFMHGSRKRLKYKLAHLSKKYNLECQTIDSFSMSLVQRYRRYLGIKTLITISPDDDPAPLIHHRSEDVLVNLSYIRNKAIELLNLKTVQNCIANTYPYVVVDEFQDCEAVLLEIIKSLSHVSVMLLAADDFQNLNSNDTDSEATQWLFENANVTQLNTTHRTSNSKILNTAAALRTNVKVTGGLPIEICTSHHLAAYKILSLINWKSWGLKGSKIAVISPVNNNVSEFIAKTLDRVGKPFPNHSTLYPITLRVENRSEDSIEDLLKRITDYHLIASITSTDLNSWSSSIKDPILAASFKAARKLFQIKGLLYLEKFQFNEIVSKQAHLFKTFGQGSKQENFIFTTIHGAKNREFDYVIVIWPYEGTSKPIPKRKLLYNAITRAKKDAIVIVQSRDQNGTAAKKDGVFSLLV